MDDSLLLSYLNNTDNWYLSNTKETTFLKPSLYDRNQIRMFRVYDYHSESASLELQKFENLLDLMKIEGSLLINLIGSINGEQQIYYGVVPDTDMIETDKDIKSIVYEAGEILDFALQIYIESIHYKELDKFEIYDILNQLSYFPQIFALEGVPYNCSDKVTELGVNKIKNGMKQNDYIIARIAKPVSIEGIREIGFEIEKMKESLAPIICKSCSIINSCTNTHSYTLGRSNSKTKTKTNTDTKTDINKNTDINTNTVANNGASSNNQNSSLSAGNNKITTRSNNQTYTITNINAKTWDEYFSNALINRIEYGKNRGLYVYSSFLFTKTKIANLQLATLLKENYQCNYIFKIPLRGIEVTSSENAVKSICMLQIPKIKKIGGNFDDYQLRAAFSQCHVRDCMLLGNSLSSKELSALYVLPNCNQ